MQNLLQYWTGQRRNFSFSEVSVWRVGPLIAMVTVVLFSAAAASEQSTGNPTPDATQMGPRCPTCPIVVAARPLSAKDKEDQASRSSEKNNFSAANAQRKLYIDDETNKMLILARDLKAKIDGLGTGRPSATMLREAAVIEFLAKDIKEKMKLTVNPD
jgi:hypothetical protein